MKILWGIFSLLLISASCALSAQEHDIKFERLSIEQGLSVSTVYCVLQDRKGFLWFGTLDGLNRYDGYTFKVYHHEPDNPYSLSYNSVRALYEDRDGLLWVGTEGGGLDRFDPTTEQFTHYRNDPNDPASLSHDTVSAISEDRAGSLWVSTWGGGLNQLNRTTGKFVRYLNDPDNPNSLSYNDVNGVYEDRNGALWVSTWGGGLNQLDRATGQFTSYRTQPDNPASLGSDTILAMYEDRFGVFWIGTDSGLNIFDRNTGRCTRYATDANDPASLSANDVRVIYEDRAGTLWIGTFGGGLNKLIARPPQNQSLQFVRYRFDDRNPQSLSQDEIRAVYEDQAGIVWVATNLGGLNSFPREQKFRHYRHSPDNPNSLNDDKVFSFYEDHLGTLWIGAWDGGLNGWNRSTGAWAHYRNAPENPQSLSSNTVTSLYEDRAGTLWVGTWDGGLNKFDRDTQQFTRYQMNADDPNSLRDNAIPAIYEDRRGTLWVGTASGVLEQFDRRAGRVTHYPIDPDNTFNMISNVVYAIGEDRAGTLWLATMVGLCKFDRATGKFTVYRNDPNNPRSLSDNTVYALREDASGTLWIGTSGGLNAFDPVTGNFISYRTKDGLPNDVIYGVLIDPSGDIWLSTNSGVARFHPPTKTFKNYTVKDGLQSNEFNDGSYYQNARGEMFFGGVHGFNAFYADEIKDNRHVPPVVITDFQILNKPVLPGKTYNGRVVLSKAITEITELPLSYKDYVFSFEFAALDYAAPEKNQYAYMMEGFDADWLYAGSRRFATYTNLPAGKYIFRVKGSNNDGVWNETGAAIRILMTPPPWKTWWAYLLYVLALIGSVVGFVEWRIKTTESQKRELEIRIRERTHELAEKSEELARSNDELAAAKIQADAANQAKSTFLANMSHELRTPMNAILGFAQVMARSRHLDPDQQENLGIIRRSGDHLLNVINNILDLSKIEAGRITLNERNFDLYRMLGDIEEMFSLKAADKHLRLLIERAAGVPQHIRTDEIKLRQIVINLLNNAMKFTEEGGVALRVSLIDNCQLSIANCQLHFEVEDTGPGIAPEELGNLFEAFVQTTIGRQSHEGTGLGLPISRKFVQLMGGDLAIGSELGRGTVCKFDIAATAVDAAEAAAPQTSRKIIAVESGQPRYRILIVDDRQDNRTLLVKLLSPLGFVLQQASNGKEAIDLWEQFQPHLVWMDIRMPVMDGYEATKFIKATPKGRATPVIALTASTLEEERGLVFAAGCDDFLRKPFREAEIFDMMHKHIGVRYVYEKQAETAARKETPQQVLTASALAALPQAVLNELQSAIEMLDLEMTKRLIEQVRSSDPVVADALSGLVKQFRFDLLQAFFSPDPSDIP